MTLAGSFLLALSCSLALLRLFYHLPSSSSPPFRQQGLRVKHTLIPHSDQAAEYVPQHESTGRCAFVRTHTGQCCLEKTQSVASESFYSA